MPITLRFVTADNLASALIRRVSRGPVSHVEFIAPDGQTVIGAFDDLGVAERPIDYETVTKDIRIAIETDKADAVYSSARALVGEPYDWKGVFGFLADEDTHEYGHL